MNWWSYMKRHYDESVCTCGELLGNWSEGKCQPSVRPRPAGDPEWWSTGSSRSFMSWVGGRDSTVPVGEVAEFPARPSINIINAILASYSRLHISHSASSFCFAELKVLNGCRFCSVGCMFESWLLLLKSAAGGCSHRLLWCWKCPPRQKLRSGKRYQLSRFDLQLQKNSVTNSIRMLQTPFNNY